MEKKGDISTFSFLVDKFISVCVVPGRNSWVSISIKYKSSGEVLQIVTVMALLRDNILLIIIICNNNKCNKCNFSAHFYRFFKLSLKQWIICLKIIYKSRIDLNVLLVVRIWRYNMIVEKQNSEEEIKRHTKHMTSSLLTPTLDKSINYPNYPTSNKGVFSSNHLKNYQQP